MKCAELLAALNEYVDGTVDPAICEEFEKHMAGCNPCQVVVDNIRKTITLYKEGKPYELPLAIPPTAPFRPPATVEGDPSRKAVSARTD